MSMAIKYAMKKRQASGRGAPSSDGECAACKDGVCMAHGGMVDRIMRKRMSEGGMVANDTHDNTADEKENEFDDLVLRDDLEFSYDGKNSGDHLGNETVDAEERDLVKRIMSSRAKKDRLPRPA